jgi:hypothetical protein
MIAAMTDPNCRWCQGAGYVCGDHRSEPCTPGVSDEACINCPVCNPYGTRQPLTDAEMDRWVSEGEPPAP